MSRKFSSFSHEPYGGPLRWVIDEIGFRRDIRRESREHGLTGVPGAQDTRDLPLLGSATAARDINPLTADGRANNNSMDGEIRRSSPIVPVKQFRGHAIRAQNQESRDDRNMDRLLEFGRGEL